jgi:hypothetical protein
MTTISETFVLADIVLNDRGCQIQPPQVGAQVAGISGFKFEQGGLFPFLKCTERVTRGQQVNDSGQRPGAESIGLDSVLSVVGQRSRIVCVMNGLNFQALQSLPPSFSMSEMS